MSDREFIDSVERCTLAGAAFHHADHVRLAWLYLNEAPLLEALDRFTTTLRRFAAHHGVPGKYHETITWAYVLLIHERMKRASSPAPWESFRTANADLFEWKPSVLERYYDRATLASEFARRVFVLPDALR
ncbi:MAG: hypothetical protein ACM3X5_05995 [Bacillota bacterium]